jgi:glycosyltransferase involved in cell wall biosynthesis
MLSIVIPIHNEEPAILPLYDRLTNVLDKLDRPYELIFVDDASTDRSFDLLANLVETDYRLKVIRLRRNFGQTAALSAGFDEAQGEVVISLDGDLQHDPEDIPALLAKIEEGYDIASGWRKNRLDNAVTRKIPSRIANWMMAKVSGVELRDFGTTFKAYRAEILKDCGSADQEHSACRGSIPLWFGAHVPGSVRHHHDPIPAEVHDAPDALLREDWAVRYAGGRRDLCLSAGVQADGKSHHDRTRSAADCRSARFPNGTDDVLHGASR